jgi:hypothetical protein
LPAGAELKSVTARPEKVGDRTALRVELEPSVAAGRPGVDYVDRPTFVVLPIEFRTGRICVDVRCAMSSDAPDYGRAFAGVAYRIDGEGEFEAIYVRALNGAKADPPAARIGRAVQYFAFPDWTYDRLREEHPAEYEAGADIGPDEWIALMIDVDEDAVRVRINGIDALRVKHPLGAGNNGRVGLFVDIGTVAHFSNLIVMAA